MSPALRRNAVCRALSLRRVSPPILDGPAEELTAADSRLTPDLRDWIASFYFDGFCPDVTMERQGRHNTAIALTNLTRIQCICIHRLSGQQDAQFTVVGLMKSYPLQVSLQGFPAENFLQLA